eukprot:1918241-Rhodomonas_salina.3
MLHSQLVHYNIVWALMGFSEGRVKLLSSSTFAPLLELRYFLCYAFLRPLRVALKHDLINSTSGIRGVQAYRGRRSRRTRSTQTSSTSTSRGRPSEL